MAPRVVTSRSGYSSLASLEAEYTEAPALVHDGVAHGRLRPGDVVGHHLLGFAAARPVADDDDVDAVLLDVGGQLGLRFLYLGARRGGVDRGVVEQLAVLVQHGHLAARAVAGVERDDARPTHGTLLQEVLGVLGEHADGVGLRALGKKAAHLAIDGQGAIRRL